MSEWKAYTVFNRNRTTTILASWLFMKEGSTVLQRAQISLISFNKKDLYGGTFEAYSPEEKKIACLGGISIYFRLQPWQNISHT